MVEGYAGDVAVNTATALSISAQFFKDSFVNAAVAAVISAAASAALSGCASAAAGRSAFAAARLIREPLFLLS